MTIKSEDQLQQELLQPGFRNRTAQMVADLSDSKFAVGGAMSCRNVPFTFVTSNWEEFTAYVDSSDTKGVVADLARGVYSIQDLTAEGGDAGGAYTNDLTMIITTPINMNIAVGLVAKGALTDFRTPQMPFTAGVPRALTIFGGANFPNIGQEMGVVINGDEGVTINVDMSQFRVVRA